MSTPVVEPPSDLALHDFAMIKQPSVLSADDEMFEAGSVTSVVRQVTAPLWVFQMYGDLVREVRHMGEAITVLVNEKQNPREIAPDLVRAYETALFNQHALFAQESTSLQQARREDYLRIEVVSI